MKRKQFSEEQIIGILKEAEAGAVVTGAVPQARDVERDLLCEEGQVRRSGGSSGGGAGIGPVIVSDIKRLLSSQTRPRR